MTQPVDTAVVRRTITVTASQQHAFEVFTVQFGTWWPKEFSIGEADMADFVVEPKVGGRWYEVGVDGKECDTGRVTAFEPPDRLDRHVGRLDAGLRRLWTAGGGDLR
jgi:hypothetical protein